MKKHRVSQQIEQMCNMYYRKNQVFYSFTVTSPSKLKKIFFFKENFGSTHTSKWICLLQNCFANYVYLKDTYITLKVEEFCVTGVKNFAYQQISKLHSYLH